MTAPGGFAPNPQVLFRGATLLFSVTFGDASGNPINPIAAALNLTYQSLAENAQLTVAMALAPPGGGSFIWTAQWDTRGVGAGPVGDLVLVAAGIVENLAALLLRRQLRTLSERDRVQGTPLSYGTGDARDYQPFLGHTESRTDRRYRSGDEPNVRDFRELTPLSRALGVGVELSQESAALGDRRHGRGVIQKVK